MFSNTMMMIIGMAAVTYLPRMIPLVALSGIELPVFVQNVLRNVPYATLGALIVPGVFFIQEDIWFGIIGAIAAFAVAYLGLNVIVVVMGSILTLLGYGLLF
ncbi:MULTISPECIES: AzlD domain-containing protein [Bacillaceae]|uniref:AzlD domain-containing protein n=1 Tax=Bacillaceae TaxID=186817 RepID=UPI000C77C736|nr:MULTISPECIES: AzlD domain-containing protein [Bacillaceae]PLR67394.1 branched-chain amino acid transporter [Bacillus sp. UMB0893]QNG59684.1 AzlD domain-containing protein [Bacillus sp. PAMC26568]